MGDIADLVVACNRLAGVLEYIVEMGMEDIVQDIMRSPTDPRLQRPDPLTAYVPKHKKGQV